jgi:hypothetical protein
MLESQFRLRVRVSVRRSASLEQLETVLRKHCSGNISQALERLRSRDEVSLTELAAAVTEGAVSLVKAYGFSQAAAERIGQGGASLAWPWRSRNVRSRPSTAALASHLSDRRDRTCSDRPPQTLPAKRSDALQNAGPANRAPQKGGMIHNLEHRPDAQLAYEAALRGSSSVSHLEISLLGSGCPLSRELPQDERNTPRDLQIGHRRRLRPNMVVVHHLRRDAYYDSATIPLQNWVLPPVSTSYTRANASLPSSPTR